MQTAEPDGAVIARRRQALGWTQKALEAKARLPRTALCRWERGARQPSPAQAQRVMIILEIFEQAEREVDAILAAS